MSKVLVVIKGGVIETFLSTVKIDLTVIDLDNHAIGEEYLESYTIDSSTQKEIKDTIESYTNIKS